MYDVDGCSMIILRINVRDLLHFNEFNDYSALQSTVFASAVRSDLIVSAVL
jgi:hypothetical protein